MWWRPYNQFILINQFWVLYCCEWLCSHHSTWDQFIFARLYSLLSSSSLYFKLVDFLRLLSLSKVIGSIIQDESVFTLLIATYEMPAVVSVWLHAFGSVNPWLLCIVIAQASLRGNCCLSCKPSSVCEVQECGHRAEWLGLFALWPQRVIWRNGHRVQWLGGATSEYPVTIAWHWTLAPAVPRSCCN